MTARWPLICGVLLALLAPFAALSEPVGDNMPTLMILPFDDDEEFVVNKNLQNELNRLGCSAGAADGRWGGQSSAALKRLIKDNPEFEGFEPSATLVALLERRTERMCALVCSPREIKVNGRCETKTCGAGLYLTSGGACRARQAAAAGSAPKPRCVTYNGRSYCN